MGVSSHPPPPFCQFHRLSDTSPPRYSAFMSIVGRVTSAASVTVILEACITRKGPDDGSDDGERANGGDEDSDCDGPALFGERAGDGVRGGDRDPAGGWRVVGGRLHGPGPGSGPGTVPVPAVMVLPLLAANVRAHIGSPAKQSPASSHTRLALHVRRTSTDLFPVFALIDPSDPIPHLKRMCEAYS